MSKPSELRAEGRDRILTSISFCLQGLTKLLSVSRFCQSQCLFAVLCGALLASSLHAFSVNIDGLESYTDPEDVCRLICIVGTIPECVSCYKQLDSQETSNQQSVQKRMLAFHSRQNRDDGCGCCALSRRSNAFCCNTCYRATIRRG
ncbi:hypothetical protein ElyMa_002794100 [Elysia marginata]|uniref:Uncharacterized protein n=1 Tax=Elysia marginata TaxID=1093978 RepID=A0AAV4HRV5_9GAST|nr:hypothetical protein ElyMa_002794100 [Elysia marginata]